MSAFPSARAWTLIPLAVEDRHLLGLIPLAGDSVGRDRLLDLGKVRRAQLDVGAERLGQPFAPTSADSGTTSTPRERAQAIATCATVAPFASATARSVSTSSRFARDSRR